MQEISRLETLELLVRVYFLFETVKLKLPVAVY